MNIFTLFLIIIASLIGLFILSFIIFFIITLKKFGTIPDKPKKEKKRSVFLRIFLDFPRQYWQDWFKREPETFPMYGLHLICGEQGSGKTVCLTEMLLRLQKQYPKLKVSTNFNYKHQDSEIKHWKDIVFDNNGIFGKTEVIDEIQNWFNSLQSKDFPIEMITEISQQRKQTKIIVGTSQVFQRVAKPIREQVTLLYRPITIAGCLTIVRVSKPQIDDNGQIMKNRFVKMYFFVHSDEIRESFDTYKKIEKMANEGFNIRNEISSLNSSVIYTAEKNRKGGLFGGKKKN